MPNAISDKLCDNLFHSFAAVEAAAPAIKAAMIPSLALAEDEPGSFARAAGIATTLVDLLIEQARPMSEGREPGSLETVAARHRLQGIDGRHYSRFGDALTPVLKDAVGPRLPGSVTAAWGDAFWLVIRRLLAAQARRADPARGEAGGRGRCGAGAKQKKGRSKKGRP